MKEIPPINISVPEKTNLTSIMLNVNELLFKQQLYRCTESLIFEITRTVWNLATSNEAITNDDAIIKKWSGKNMHLVMTSVVFQVHYDLQLGLIFALRNVIEN